MIASALEEMAETFLEEGKPLPSPNPALENSEAGFERVDTAFGGRGNSSSVKRHQVIRQPHNPDCGPLLNAPFRVALMPIQDPEKCRLTSVRKIANIS